MIETLESTERELVSIKRIAVLLDYEESTIRDMVFDGKIPYVKMPTGSIRFHIPTIRKWYSAGVVDAVA